MSGFQVLCFPSIQAAGRDSALQGVSAVVALDGTIAWGQEAWRQHNNSLAPLA